MKPLTFKELMEKRSDVRPDKCIGCGGPFQQPGQQGKEFFNHGKDMRHMTWCRKCTEKWKPYAQAQLAKGLNPCPAYQIMVEARRAGRI